MFNRNITNAGLRSKELKRWEANGNNNTPRRKRGERICVILTCHKHVLENELLCAKHRDNRG